MQKYEKMQKTKYFMNYFGRVPVKTKQKNKQTKMLNQKQLV